MRVLVTGAGGFVGGHLAERLVRDGHQVVAGIHGPAATPPWLAGADVRAGDVRDPAWRADALAGCEVVLHAAAVVPPVHGGAATLRAINRDAAAALAREAIAAGVRRVVLLSTTGVYGSRSVDVLDEGSPCRPDTVYRATKLAAERAVLTACGGAATVVRLSHVMGPRCTSLRGLAAAVARPGFRIIGDGRQRWHGAHVDDVVALVQRAALAPEAAGETFVACAPSPMTVAELLAVCAETLRAPPPRGRLPAGPYRVLEAAARGYFRLTGRDLAIAQRYHLFLTDRRYSGAKAERLLGVTCGLSVADGVRQALRTA